MSSSPGASAEPRGQDHRRKARRALIAAADRATAWAVWPVAGIAAWEQRLLAAEVIDLLQQAGSKVADRRPDRSDGAGAGAPDASGEALLVEILEDLDEAKVALYQLADRPAPEPVPAGPLAQLTEPTGTLERKLREADGQRREMAVYRRFGAQAHDIREQFAAIRVRIAAQAFAPAPPPRPAGPAGPLGPAAPPGPAGPPGPIAPPHDDERDPVKADDHGSHGKADHGAAAKVDPPDLDVIGVGDAGRYRATADDLRARVDALAKTLGALGTTAITGVGIARIDGVFPAPAGSWWLVLLAIAAFAVAAGAVLWIAVRLNQAAGPLSLRSDLRDMVDSQEITEDERRRIVDIYQQTAEQGGAHELLAYELRGIRLQRIRDWIGDKECIAACTTRAKEIAADVEVTLARASVRVIRRRATTAVTSYGAVLLYAAFIVAAIGFAVTTSALAGRQSGDIATVKSCADAAAAVNGAATETVTTATTVTTGTSTTSTTVVQPAVPTNLKALPAVCRPSATGSQTAVTQTPATTTATVPPAVRTTTAPPAGTTTAPPATTPTVPPATTATVPPTTTTTTTP